MGAADPDRAVDLRDPRLDAIEWRDLCSLSRLDVARELGLGLPWLVASLAFAHLAIVASWPWLVPALGCSFMFFLCGLRQVHGAFHQALGLRPAFHELLIFVLSPVMLSAMHAIQWNHLRHHRRCMADDDVEATSARMPGWKALVAGPLFPLRLHLAALAGTRGRTRRWILAELAAMTMVVTIAFGVLDGAVLRYHVIAMTIGQCLVGFFAVWTVHRGCDGSRVIARTLRNPLKSFVSYDMFYHVEHHLFPAVPTRRLHVLARRIDAVVPELRRMTVW